MVKKGGESIFHGACIVVFHASPDNVAFSNVQSSHGSQFITYVMCMIIGFFRCLEAMDAFTASILVM